MKNTILARAIGVGVIILCAAPAWGEDGGRALTPAQELTTFHFADPSLVAELAAAEPQVSSPVAMTWDAEGRMFVAEMRDYPNARDGGAIRQLDDRDADGTYESAALFADHLPFPNSVLPWNGGLLVTAAPDLWFLRDTDGDGHADERRILFTGFGTGNQQLRANGLFWGLDGWVYGANGRSDGEIRPVERWQGGAWVKVDPKPAETISLRGRDFRFRPATGEFETLAGRSQFGHTRDDWGNRFLSWNTIPLRHEVFPDHDLARNPRLTISEVVQDCLPSGDSGQVFPLTPPPLVFNNESGSHFNALSGLHIFRGDALGAGYQGSAFVGESLRNLVHRRVLVPDGPTFRADRGEEGREFLASTDPWFHPVNFATGPDGTLYLADFYRRFVEHPDWVAREMRERVGWSAGSEHGRIWRIRQKDRPFHVAGSQLGLAQVPPARWVEELESPNGWRRDTAQRLLIEHHDASVAAALLGVIQSSKLASIRVQALYTSATLGLLEVPTIVSVLGDREPHVRAAAAQLTGARWVQLKSDDHGRGALTTSLVALKKDADPEVQLQAALAFGAIADAEIREAALAQVVASTTNRWIRLAAASSTQLTNAPWIAALSPPAVRSRPAPVPLNPDPDRQRVISQFQPALRLSGDRTRGAATISKLCLACHYLQGHGQRVGPDLSGSGTRPAETLLVDVLDPSRQIAPDYVAYEIVTTDGRTVAGLIASETATRLTVRHPNASDESIARSQIQEIRTTNRSLMPEGLEAGLTTQDFADLLAFLRSPDGDLLPK